MSVIVTTLGVYKTDLLEVTCVFAVGILALISFEIWGVSLWGSFAPFFLVRLGLSLS
ncbi:Bcr/CflA family drug resistance efflux transporter, partial [Francisella tularensis]|nr:Bcr/CflA family drug resistance efflux transporter [Francisella tularensis]